MDTQLDAQKAKLRSVFVKAEEHLKEAERFFSLESAGDRKGLLVPALNELRYSAFHMSKTFEMADDASICEELLKASKHCERAIYDVLEIQILVLLRKLSDFLGDFRWIPLDATIPNLYEDKIKIDEIQESHREADKEASWDNLSAQVATLREIYRKWDAARSELVKKQRAYTWDRLKSIIAVLAMFATIATAIISVLCYLK